MKINTTGKSDYPESIRVCESKHKQYMKLFRDLGYGGHTGAYYPFLLINRKEKRISGDGHEDYSKYVFESFDEWYFYKSDYIKVVLNQEHTAKVYQDKITVGCAEFPVKIIDELEKAHIKITG